MLEEMKSYLIKNNYKFNVYYRIEGSDRGDNTMIVLYKDDNNG